ncbi:MAG TPA: RNA methyltransferase, partial [Luteitalea sp.]|nr:RNA methyltransferase [Luteitalea sp.]
DALTAHMRIDTILVAEGSDRRPEIAAILTRATRQHVDVQPVTPAVMDAASPTRTPSGIVALAQLSLRDPADVVAPEPALVTMAMGVQDPGNLGTLIRSAEAAGGTGLVVDTSSAHPLSWKVLRGSMGSALRLPVARVESPLDHLRDWQAHGLRIVALVGSGDVPLHECDLRAPTVVCAGAEGRGLPDDVLALADVRVRIAMRAPVESLNVGVATSLVLFEAARQRSEAITR